MSRTVSLGIFVVLSLVSLATTVFLIGDKSHLFAHTYELVSRFDNVAGLETGAHVRIGGTSQGTVSAITLPDSPDGKMTVSMELDEATKALIRKDSIATIRTEGLLGARFVEISFGSVDGEPVDNGDEIAGKPTLGMDDLMVKADKILDTAGTAMKHINASTGNLASITDKIDDGKGTAGALVHDRALYDDARRATAAVLEVVDTIKQSRFFKTLFRPRKQNP